MSVFDRLLHPSLRSGDPDEIRRARTTAAFLGVGWIGAAAMLPMMLAANDMMAVATIAVSLVITAVPIALLRFRAMRELATHAMLVNTVLSLTPSVSSQGGLGGSAVDWFGVLPLLAMMLLKRGAFAWLLITLAIVATFGVLHMTGFLPPAAATADAQLRVITSQLCVPIGIYFLARAFERNRSGMERALRRARVDAEQAHATAQGVLDSTDQGLFTMDAEGRIGAAVSAAAIRWFGAPTPGSTAWAWLADADAKFSAWLELGFAAHREGFLPPELTLAQLPVRLQHHGRDHAVRWLATGEHGELLAVVTDVTETREAERAERSQRDVVALLAHSIRDRQGVLELLDEADAIVRGLATHGDSADDARRIHTLKGNVGLFGLAGLAEHCHELENRMAERDGVLDEDDRNALVESWTELRMRIAPLIGRQDSGTIAIPRDEIEIVVDAIRTKRSPAELEQMVRRWSYEPMSIRLARIAEHARALAQRLGKSALEVHVADNGVALAASAWGPFWSSFAHVVRNAMDHGIESSDERTHAGKPASGGLWLAVELDDELAITIRDDGRGIDWDGVRRRAVACGLPSATQQDLERALFAEGFTTKEVVTAISGRGVGMAAIAEATRQLGGRIVLRSELGRGTTFEFRFPASAAFESNATLSRAA
ncbi:MAG TPA: ATP-binding protein [Nannocystaceae bacterium]|nr:ATP-binding protein [Nannocystaceae bacterium]